MNIIAPTIPRDCADWAAKGETLSGEFEINIEGEYLISKSFKASAKTIMTNHFSMHVNMLYINSYHRRFISFLPRLHFSLHINFNIFVSINIYVITYVYHFNHHIKKILNSYPYLLQERQNKFTVTWIMTVDGGQSFSVAGTLQWILTGTGPTIVTDLAT